ncbi:MAG TPA: M23 family metallopeptidase [Nitrospirae bacterium]|nr:M23 family metallopeptidase [Nitrospirota bacterium]
MRNYGYRKKSRFNARAVSLILLFILIIAGISYGAYKLFFIAAPVVEGLEAFSSLPIEKIITLTGHNLKSIDIYIYQGDRKIDLLKDIPEIGEKTYSIQVKPKDLGLVDGSAQVIVRARSGILKDIKHTISSTIDTVPPKLEVLGATSNIYQGSGGVAHIRAEGAESVFIKLNEHIFSAFKSQSGSGPESSSEYFAFFPAPIDTPAGSTFYAVAKDAAGNRAIRALPSKLREKEYSSSLINIDDAFINTVISPLLNELDISDPVKAFKKVNEEWRLESVNKVRDIAGKTTAEILWQGSFLQMKNSMVMAKYGDKRTYIYNGNAVSQSTHLGYDLASVEKSPVEAANSGIVRFTGEIGIYGNTVIIDHGLGLMSIYGHLSTILETEGQSVEKGEIIARTGSTGLAGGDHLHFGILIQGYEVSPLYWWDNNWIKVNVLKYLK